MTMILSKGLLSATREALQVLNRHYPRKFAVAFEKTYDAEQFVQEWAQAFVSCDFDKIPEAARRWVATEKYPPSAAEVGTIARQLTLENRPAVTPTASTSPEPSLWKNGARIDALYFAAKERLVERGYTRDVFSSAIGQCWALLYEVQPTEEQREAVRSGDVELDVWYSAVDLWVAGRRPRGHPMNNLGGAMANVMMGRSA